MSVGVFAYQVWILARILKSFHRGIHAVKVGSDTNMLPPDDIGNVFNVIGYP
jgi:hypothetical protein